jgi:hypothetical protein
MVRELCLCSLLSQGTEGEVRRKRYEGRGIFTFVKTKAKEFESIRMNSLPSTFASFAFSTAYAIKYERVKVAKAKVMVP